MRNLVILVGVFISYLGIFSGPVTAFNLMDTRLPPYVPVRGPGVDYIEPPAWFPNPAGVAWIQCIYDERFPEESSVQIDFLKLYATVGGQEVCITTDDYDSADDYDNIDYGGFWSKIGWYQHFYGYMPADFVSDGMLTLPVSDYPDFVLHAWSTAWPRTEIPEDVDLCFIEARFKVTGSAFVMFGCDYYQTPTSNWPDMVEAFHSKWFGEGDWKIIRFPFPSLNYTADRFDLD
ncbi:hypothetical protein JW979_09295 [bacterium]|nr:hypothetical protein [candidate division CSSED10-310 bacterium]